MSKSEDRRKAFRALEGQNNPEAHGTPVKPSDPLTVEQLKALLEMSKMGLPVNLPEYKWQQVLNAALAHLEYFSHKSAVAKAVELDKYGPG